MNVIAAGPILLLAVLAVGCNESADLPPGPSAASPVPVDPGEPTRAQPTLRTMRLYIGPKQMLAELALTPQEIRTGMMFRTNMEPNSGMLFALPYTQRASFWMKNCPYPLSVAYINEEGIIEEIHKLEPHNTNSVVAGTENIRFVLETPRGWFEQNGIQPGVAVATEQGPLYKTFFARR